MPPHRQARNKLAGGKTNSAPIKLIAKLIEASNIWTNTDFCSRRFPPPTQSRDRRALAGARQPSAASTIKTNNSIHLIARRGGDCRCSQRPRSSCCCHAGLDLRTATSQLAAVDLFNLDCGVCDAPLSQLQDVAPPLEWARQITGSHGAVYAGCQRMTAGIHS